MSFPARKEADLYWIGKKRLFLTLLSLSSSVAFADPRSKEYDEVVVPLLEYYCYDCHGDGRDKGDFSFDEFEDLETHLNDQDFWLAAWRNLRSQIMPPSEEEQPTAEEKRELMSWIERRVFQLDPQNPDPGRVTIRRLNRSEYRYSVSDLLGVNYEVRDNFPPDDTGYGFDTIGDVLSLSPLLMEKYIEAAETVMLRAIPEDAAEIPGFVIKAHELREKGDTGQTARNMEFDIDHVVETKRHLEHKGTYRVHLNFSVAGSMEATNQTAILKLLVNGKERKRQKVGWDYRKKIELEDTLFLEKGDHVFALHIQPEHLAEEGQDNLGVVVKGLTVEGPTEGGWWAYPASYKNIFFEGLAKEGEAVRREYARKIFERLVTRAFRRPVDDATVQRLVEMTMAVDREEGKLFEDGIRYAMTAVLVSPRFLFRAEVQPQPDDQGTVVDLDEWALASRLSYFLWSSVPDEELMQLASEGKLRQNLREQVDRMLRDQKSRRFARNFMGQWFQARDVEGMHLNARRILGKGRRASYRTFSSSVRRAMRQETEMLFHHVLRENRSVLELINADYTFLNERLAKFYEIEGVEGEDLRKVPLSKDSKRGGLLTQGTFLIVTSNPTRTSPVKRGLFILDNILGTPAPPAPPDVPELEEQEKHGGEHLSIREQMAIHMAEPMCKSCHARMDPLGLALENYNALGMWRDQENGQAIDTAGVLMTGEKFGTMEELKEILVTSRKQDFLRCLTEKLMTYALGRGMEYYDSTVIEGIVERLEGKDGMRELIYEVVESVPFQKRRGG